MVKTDEHPYLMEHSGEGERLVRKTRAERVIQQARWAGLKPGMRVLDVGCGAGFTTSLLAEISGSAEGLDLSLERIESARKSYPELSFHQRDIYQSLEGLGPYDFIWIRFFLEYHRRSSAEIIQRISGLLAERGILCVAELDHHSLNHYPMDERMQRTLSGLSEYLQKHADWDPYAGRKLYTHFYDAGFENIELRFDAHHLIYGKMESVQESDWLTKLNVAARKCGYPFDEYEGGFDEFLVDAENLLVNPRRFTYTPIIICRGIRPDAR
ncbi:hypothetical protein B4O97_11615 [Marispirochaeta aestuarii]|uniref:Methyltransferase domain-containing protein n=1 Tax=Marispirochaeta aestuarii TaxID=1963862 RepID=A0A1Y1RWH4_9SPIO|nr:class I SAM-dependent methyltransferase [Marispirochaeta aestuarii]ORC34595.1 hypothetical protein B4O97_11615 [Marispirochaeta aestuarii]